jgi:hypothetical protein
MTEVLMPQLRSVVFRGLPKEVEEELNKFLETVPCHIHSVTQSESGDHISVIILYEPYTIEP